MFLLGSSAAFVLPRLLRLYGSLSILDDVYSVFWGQILLP